MKVLYSTLVGENVYIVSLRMYPFMKNYLAFAHGYITEGEWRMMHKHLWLVDRANRG